MRIALLQLNSSDDPSENLETVRGLMKEAAAQKAEFIATPEVTNCLSSSRTHQNNTLKLQGDDPTLAGLRAEAKDLGVWLLIGSLGLKSDDPDGRFANRSFLIDPSGEIAAWYDKIHMFDVDIDNEESYRESAGYRPGGHAMLASTPFAKIGMTVCYDVRFPALHRSLAQAGAGIITVPAAFSHVTGAAHWEPLLRARAIETGCFVIAPAQTGTHKASRGKPRKTHGHSMIIDPWGKIILDAEKEPGLYIADIDLAEIKVARQRVPSLEHDRPYILRS